MNKKIFIFNILLFLIISTISLVFFIYLPSKIFPADDALILFRYAENFAETGVISYNYKKYPVEGATDFLWMVILAVLYKCGISVWSSALLISYLSLLCTGYIYYKIFEPTQRIVFLLIVLLLLVFKTTYSAIVGFSTLFFGLCILTVLYSDIRNRSIHVFISSLVTCLVRPDGCFFIIPIILHFFLKNKERLVKTFLYFFVFFLLPGLTYFFWRYNYFGFLFPLPFYIKKGHNIINVNSLIENINFNFPFFIIFFLLGIYFLYKKFYFKTDIIVYFIFILIVPFVFYSKITLLQNFCNRFQYPFIIINLFIITLICKINDLKKCFFYSLVFLTIYASFQSYQSFLNLWFMQYQNLYHIAIKASKEIPNALLLTTESGVIPYYTRWETIDAFGLNTPAFTKKVISPNDIKQFSPDIVLINYMWDLYYIIDLAHSMEEAKEKSWQGMVRNIIKGLDTVEYNIILLPAYAVEKINNDVLYSLLQRHDRDFLLHYDKMYYCFLIKKNFIHAKIFEKILFDFNAVTYSSFQDTVRPLLEKNIRSLNLLPPLFPPL